MLARIIPFFRSPTFWLGSLGGAIFLLFFYFHYQDIDPAKYTYRDDGIITLSHAKNFVDHGHIGVDPSGKRIEGFSAPAQFWIYTVVYGLTHLHWLDFATAQTVLCTFLIGFFFIQFFRKQPFPGLLMTTFAAWFLTWHVRFLEWHGSGMENAWTHLFFLLLVYLSWRMVERGKINYWWVIWGFLAVVSRTESVFHIAPVLVLFAGYYRSRHQSWRGLHWALAVGAAWSLYQGWRIYYFGCFFPNTGLAQEISVSDNLRRLWNGDEAWLRLASQWARDIFRLHGGWFWALILLTLPFLQHREKWIWPLLVLFSLSLTAFLNPFVFGMTRLDIARSTTFLALFMALGLAHVLPRLRLKGNTWVVLPLLIGLLVVGRIFRPLYLEPPRHLCCAVDNFSEKAWYANEFAAQNDLHRLQFANPDLGKLSYLKDFNLTDLGFLGSPVLAHLRHNDYLLRTWFYEFVRPDVVETHGEWSVLHGRLFSDARFRMIYEPLHETREGYLDELGGAYPQIGEGIFVRKELKDGASNPERRLVSDLKQMETAEERVQRMVEELLYTTSPKAPLAHQYVVRTAYRFLPELEGADNWEEFEAGFDNRITAPVDLALLQSGHRGNWSDEIVDWLQQNRGIIDADPITEFYGHPGQLIIDRDRWRFYALPGNRLVGSLLAPEAFELAPEMALHVFIADKEVALKKNPWGADFMDFSWDSDCAREWHGELFWEVQLPREPLEAVIVGQNGPDGALWRARAVWPNDLEF